ETRAVKEKKHILRGISVFRVQRFYSGRGSSEYLLIALAMLGWRIGEIAQDRELQVRIAIGEVLHLEMLERFINPAYAAKQCRHYDSGHVFFGNPLIAKLQLGEQSRRHQHRYQLIDDADSDFACRQQRDQRHDQANRRWSALHYLQNHAQCHHREERNPAKIESVRMPLRPAIYPFARRRSVTDATFENPTSLVDQEITDVRMPGVARIGKLRQLDNFTRNFFFRSLHTLPN